MKTKLTYTLLAAAAACGFAQGQATTAYTTPVGYVSLGDTTVGQPAIKANTDVAVSIPLDRATEYAGEVAATTASTIQVAGTPAWALNQWVPGGTPGNTVPYLVTIRSGGQNGFIGLITGNDANTLTVTPVTAGSLLSPSVVAGDDIKIHKAWTLISMFPSGTFSPGVRVFGFSGSAPGINLAPDINVVWNGTNWTKAGGVVGNDTIFYTGESFFIRTLAAQVATLTLSGEVPTGFSRTYIDKIAAGVAQDTRVGYVSPVDELIGNSGLSAKVTPGDRLFGFNNNAAGINKAPTDNVLWNGTNWTIAGGVIVNTTFALQGGKGYYIRRLAAAPVGSADWVDQQSYLPLP